MNVNRNKNNSKRSKQYPETEVKGSNNSKKETNKENRKEKKKEVRGDAVSYKDLVDSATAPKARDKFENLVSAASSRVGDDPISKLVVWLVQEGIQSEAEDPADYTTLIKPNKLE